eukprot:412019_1
MSKYSSSILKSVIFVLIYNIKSTLSQNYTGFITQTCDSSNEYYDTCSCNLAQWSVGGPLSSVLTDFNCFTQFNCFYSSSTNEFCSGHGYCDFITAECECDTEYGGDSCNETYSQFLPSTVVTYGMIGIAALLLLWSIGLMFWA